MSLETIVEPALRFVASIPWWLYLLGIIILSLEKRKKTTTQETILKE